MRKIINKTLLVIILIICSMSFVSCEAIEAQNITHNSAVGVNSNQDRTRPGTNGNTNMNNRPGANGNTGRNVNPGTDKKPAQ